MPKFSPVVLTVLALSLIVFSSARADEEFKLAMRQVAHRAHVTFAKTKYQALKERIENSRLEPEKYPLAESDQKYLRTTEPSKEYEDAVSTERWRGLMSEVSVIIWMSKSLFGNSDSPEGYIYIDNQSDEPLQDVTLTWKAIDSTGRVIYETSVPDLHARPKALTRAGEINFSLSNRGGLPVPSEVEIQASIDFEEGKKESIPYSTYYTLQVALEGFSPTKFTGGVFGKPGEVYHKDAWGNFITKNSEAGKNMRGSDGFFDGGNGNSGGSSRGFAPRRRGLFR